MRRLLRWVMRSRWYRRTVGGAWFYDRIRGLWVWFPGVQSAEEVDRMLNTFRDRFDRCEFWQWP